MIHRGPLGSVRLFSCISLFLVVDIGTSFGHVHVTVTVESLGQLSLCVSVSELLVVCPGLLSSSSLLHKSGVPVLVFAWVSDTVVSLEALPASLGTSCGKGNTCCEVAILIVVVQEWCLEERGKARTKHKGNRVSGGRLRRRA